MRTPPQLCPVHLYERLLCDEECIEARNELKKLGRAYRQYWYDRRRGVPPQRRFTRYHRRDVRPVWAAWSAA
jgi:hypothetical protein